MTSSSRAPAERHPTVQGDATLFASTARPNAEIRTGALDCVAEPDLLVAHKPGQAHPMLLAFAGGVRNSIVGLFRHATLLRPRSIDNPR
jgi:hypothetical protein